MPPGGTTELWGAPPLGSIPTPSLIQVPVQCWLNSCQTWVSRPSGGACAVSGRAWTAPGVSRIRRAGTATKCNFRDMSISSPASPSPHHHWSDRGRCLRGWHYCVERGRKAGKAEALKGPRASGEEKDDQ